MDYGLIGQPLGHSLSKPIHESLADYTYDLHPLTKEEFTSYMEEKPFRAINVTIPYKRDVIPYLDSMDDNAKAIGAVNTIVNTDGKLRGYNTDFSGFDYMVNRHSVKLTDKKVVVLGNGGAAQAIKAVVRKHQAKEIIVVDVVSDGESITYDELFASHTDAQVIINTSPIGMYPKVDASPVDLAQFPDCQAVMDVVYNPLTTKLVAQARELGMIGVTVPDNIRCIVFEGEKEHPLIAEELMMPILGMVRAKDIDDAIEKAVWLEHGNRHSAHIHSKNIDNITKYAREIDTAILVKNAPSYAALGFGGEGYCTFTIASRTGEGLTSTKSFTKSRRCVMSDSLCIR